MNCSQVNYVDDRYYREKFKEIQDISVDASTYPVFLVSLRVGWMLQTEYGKEYLNEILHSEDLEFYRVKTIKMLIEFLYQRFKNTLVKYLLPLYIMQLIVYIL